ncbi:MAG TPA: hypothetical protein VN607_09375 [Gemmatimonadaceae bacterium]|nr:hypothetical protein [Gemmatimonadaceae bacterium]
MAKTIQMRPVFDCSNCGEQVTMCHDTTSHSCRGCGAVYVDVDTLRVYNGAEFDSAAEAEAADATPDPVTGLRREDFSYYLGWFTGPLAAVHAALAAERAAFDTNQAPFELLNARFRTNRMLRELEAALARKEL